VYCIWRKRIRFLFLSELDGYFISCLISSIIIWCKFCFENQTTFSRPATSLALLYRAIFKPPLKATLLMGNLWVQLMRNFQIWTAKNFNVVCHQLLPRFFKKILRSNQKILKYFFQNSRVAINRQNLLKFNSFHRLMTQLRLSKLL